jgi:hypothetical protein
VLLLHVLLLHVLLLMRVHMLLLLLLLLLLLVVVNGCRGWRGALARLVVLAAPRFLLLTPRLQGTQQENIAAAARVLRSFSAVL